MKPFYLIAFPLAFLVATGLIYTNWLMWTDAGGVVTTVGSLANVIPTNDPLFNLLTGNYGQMFSSLATLAFGGSLWKAFTIPLPEYVTVTIGPWALDVPWLAITSIPITVPPLFYGGWEYTFYIPWLTATTVPLWIPSFWIPWFTFLGSGYDIYFPSLSSVLPGAILGSIMIFFGLASSINTPIGGISVGSSGAKVLQTIGIGMLLWSFISLFTGTWILSLGTAGTVLMGMLELMFVLGLYWQTQSSE